MACFGSAPRALPDVPGRAPLSGHSWPRTGDRVARDHHPPGPLQRGAQEAPRLLLTSVGSKVGVGHDSTSFTVQCAGSCSAGLRAPGSAPQRAPFAPLPREARDLFSQSTGRAGRAVTLVWATPPPSVRLPPNEGVQRAPNGSLRSASVMLYWAERLAQAGQIDRYLVSGLALGEPERAHARAFRGGAP